MTARGPFSEGRREDFLRGNKSRTTSPRWWRGAVSCARWVSDKEALWDAGKRTMCGGRGGSWTGGGARRVHGGKKTRLNAERLVFLLQNDAAVLNALLWLSLQIWTDYKCLFPIKVLNGLTWGLSLSECSTVCVHDRTIEVPRSQVPGHCLSPGWSPLQNCALSLTWDFFLNKTEIFFFIFFLLLCKMTFNTL